MSNTANLKQLTASTFALALKTQNFHWNVSGMSFAALHNLFESQYDALYEQTDDLAERVRALGERMPGSLKDFSELSAIKDAGTGHSAEDMVKELADDHTTLSGLMLSAANSFAEKDDSVTEDMLIGFAQAHDKTAWMLKAHMG